MLSGGRAQDVSFTEEEIYAIEQHRFAPLTRLFWREAEPRYTSLDTLIDDLETRPGLPQLSAAPEAIDLAVLKRLADRVAAYLAQDRAVAELPKAARERSGLSALEREYTLKEVAIMTRAAPARRPSAGADLG